MRSENSWSGHVLLAEDHGLFVGTAGNADLHASPAIKICVSLDEKFGLADGSELSFHTAAVIPAGTEHSIEGRSCRMAMLLLAPEGELGQKLSGLSECGGTVSIDHVSEQLGTTLSSTVADVAGFDRLGAAAVGIIAADLRTSVGPLDRRVVQSIEWIRAGRENGILVKDIAAEVDLSESRFSHLFTEHIRVPLRRYLLWLRLRDALHILSTAENLTEAAHTAGFSDSAHLSRTFRMALGIAPSDIVRRSTFMSFLK